MTDTIQRRQEIIEIVCEIAGAIAKAVVVLVVFSLITTMMGDISPSIRESFPIVYQISDTVMLVCKNVSNFILRIIG